MPKMILAAAFLAQGITSILAFPATKQTIARKANLRMTPNDRRNSNGRAIQSHTGQFN